MQQLYLPTLSRGGRTAQACRRDEMRYPDAMSLPQNGDEMRLSSTRPATKADAPAMVAILNDYIARSTAIFIMEPQTLDDRLQWFAERSECYPAIACDVDGTLVGWGALSVYNPRGAYRHTAEISVYVHADFHRRGIGRLIVTELIASARAAGHHTLIANCCAESAASIALHEALGFVRVGQFREIGRKFDRWLDVVSLQLLL